MGRAWFLRCQEEKVSWRMLHVEFHVLRTNSKSWTSGAHSHKNTDMHLFRYKNSFFTYRTNSKVYMVIFIIPEKIFEEMVSSNLKWWKFLFSVSIICRCVEHFSPQTGVKGKKAGEHQASLAQENVLFSQWVKNYLSPRRIIYVYIYLFLIPLSPKLGYFSEWKMPK